MHITPKLVGILIFPEVEVLDVCGPFEVFSVTRLTEARRREEPSPFQVSLIAEHPDPVVATGGLRFLPDYGLDNCPALDILVIPGGWGTRQEMTNPTLLNWINQKAPTVETLTSVCTGALLLGKSGLLDGKRATTHWAALDLMQNLFPQVTVEREWHVVEAGNVLTSAGISAGIDMALKVVSRYYGEAIARATATYMEYPFPTDLARRISISST